MYKERSKPTKFIDFVNFKVQKRSQFIIILALIFRVTVLNQQIFKFLLVNYCPIDPMENAMRAVPSHPLGHFPWESHSHLQAWILPTPQTLFFQRQKYLSLQIYLLRLLQHDCLELDSNLGFIFCR